MSTHDLKKPAPPLTPFSEGAGTGDPSPFRPHIKAAVADQAPAAIAVPQGGITPASANRAEIQQNPDTE
jgi:hypothetical protein